ncbi:SMP-30/gluconolactonase/LRE family protein [Pseudomonas sp. 10B1]|uniref:SMP-30/gluconolactonase/LRE family protein n=1 Tax=unclassified Pseudomonas TaxID=196821 RepID=UPI002AB45BEC|nr:MULTISPECIES: SMP-30/gluconolactonase/LRE family protein [unclassified Pseudomonas]MDY7560841.1 SMP-30/gluconolactonase/LRE family protein [Pseudomonas sp. AB6]MEA9976491.1 SMP-30/gluconolactonase/LRE family protein [Pseudomonas sp. RTS4]MEA9996215.1 SMP-30/gluconolactonase/LRE family protein [Pseudomonas sp. AA4]MEB0088819.1 SMP-30/gluconolactonase/LRE family protein [Pseudomonas sp. RTI1]MEB0128009.1 SMP-30/gluconolactonase/LRE family protein [Pseudomonas sp. CCC1.2]
MHWLPVSEKRFKLAEGPFWDREHEALYWVDIAGFLACRLSHGRYHQWRFAEPVSAFIPCESGDALVTLASGVYRLDLCSPSDQPHLTLFCLVDPVAGNRPNEARCDAQGRLWLGSMQNNLDAYGGDLPVIRRSGGLFRVDPDASVTPLLSEQGIVNTLLWNSEATAVFSADSLDGVIYRYSITSDGRLGARSIWAAAHSRGDPDGSAMDVEGYVWNARWDGHCLIRFAPDGAIDRVVELPVSHPTSCVFGGPDLSTLYVTSAAPASANGVLAGALLMAQVGVAGMACHRFAG